MGGRQSGRDGAGLDPLGGGRRDGAENSPGRWRQYATGRRGRGVRGLPAGERRRQRAAVGGSARGAVPRIPAVATAAAACQPPAIAFCHVGTPTGVVAGLVPATAMTSFAHPMRYSCHRLSSWALTTLLVSTSSKHL